MLESAEGLRYPSAELFLADPEPSSVIKFMVPAFFGRPVCSKRGRLVLTQAVLPRIRGFRRIFVLSGLELFELQLKNSKLK